MILIVKAIIVLSIVFGSYFILPRLKRNGNSNEINNDNVSKESASIIYKKTWADIKTIFR